MCDVERKLLAWLDKELPEEEAAEVERHVRACAECQERAAIYERVSSAFEAHCEVYSTAARLPVLATNNSASKRGALAIGALAAALVLVLIIHYERRPSPVVPRAASPQHNAPRSALAQAVSNSTKSGALSAVRKGSSGKARQRDVAQTSRGQNTNLLPAGPAVEIAVPADAVLPPGAAPAGANFLVDVTIAPDGSAQGIRVRPELAGFERRANQP